MNKISLVAAAAVMALGSVSAQAGSAVGNVNVSANLTAKCEATAAAALDFTYEAFQTADATKSSNVVFKCTRGLGGAPTAVLDSTEGTVAGLRYTLSAATGVKAAGTAEDGTGIGTPDSYSYSVTGTIANGQAGAASTGTTDTRTLTVTY